MPQPIGNTYDPSAANSERRGSGYARDQAQHAIQTLSYQLPKFAGASRRNLSPQQGQSFSGSPISQAVLQSVLRTILGVDAASSLNMGDGGSSDPAGVYGPSEVSPSMLQGYGGGRSPAPVIHPGGDGRMPSGLPSETVPMDPNVPTFDRTTSGQPREQSPYAGWIPGERELGRYQQGYQQPDFGGGRGYY